jgi:serine/threonine-protein kinase
MLTGVRPFKGATLGAVCAEILNTKPAPPSRHNPEVPAELDAVMAKCLAKNPADRFASCEELARALYPFARSRPAPPPSPARKPKSRRTPRKTRRPSSKIRSYPIPQIW